METKIEQFLSTFQKGYTLRDVDYLEEFMETFFDDAVHISIMGTGNSEIFNSKETAKELFSSDWLYWGDFVIQPQTVKHKTLDDYHVIVVSGKVTYTFRQDEATIKRYQESIKAIIKDASSNDINHMIYQQHKAHYILDHFLHKRDGDIRKNDYPVHMVFVCQEIHSQFKIRALTFTHPLEGGYPDERLHPYTGYIQDHQRSIDELIKLGCKTDVPSIFDIKPSNDFMFVDIDGVTYDGEEAKKKYYSRISYYDDIVCNEDIGLVYKQGNIYTAAYIGHVSKTIEVSEAIKNLNDRIKAILDSELDDKDQLFKVRREMSIVNKETTLGAMHTWPFRIFVVMKKIDGVYKLELIQFGYPMDMILEDKHL